jgi:non-specific protein-tyrosine kinase
MIQADQARSDALAAQASRTVAEDAQLQQLQSQLASLRATYASLLGYSSDTGSSQLTLVEPAVSPAEPSSPRVILNTALAGIVGLFLALGSAFLFEYLDDTVKTTQDVEGATGLATLGAIIRMKGGRERKEMYRLATILYPQSPVAEAYRALRTNLEFADVDRAIRTLLVTSSIPGEGKTTTAANLAVAFAQAGRRTILVDADLRKPAIQRIFDIPNQFGLSDLLRSDAVSPEAVLVGTEQPHLRVLPTGKLPPNPAELLGSHRMRKILDRLLTDADLVILDSPPVQAVTDPAVLGARVDATLLVVDAGRTRKGVVGHAREQLAKTGARVVGVTINRLHGSDANGYYHHYGSYGHAGETSRPAPALDGVDR